MSNTFGNVKLINGSSNIEIYAKAGLATTYEIPLPTVAPQNGQTWAYNATGNQFAWVDFPTPATPVTINLALTVPTNEFQVTGNPYTGGNGTFALSWKSQLQNTFLAAPSNANGNPLFRAIVDADLPAQISASKINGTLAKANIPNGTNATSFQIDSANAGVVLNHNAGILELYNSNLSAFADLKVRNLFITGSIDELITTTVNLGDTVLLLNSLFVTGTPTENAGISVRRGSSGNASNTWDEVNDRWVIGLDSNLLPSTRTASVSFTSTDVVASSYTFNHNLNNKYPSVTLIDNTGKPIGVTITYSNTTSCLIDLSRLTVTGTWQLTAVG